MTRTLFTALAVCSMLFASGCCCKNTPDPSLATHIYWDDHGLKKIQSIGIEDGIVALERSGTRQLINQMEIDPDVPGLDGPGVFTLEGNKLLLNGTKTIFPTKGMSDRTPAQSICLNRSGNLAYVASVQPEKIILFTIDYSGEEATVAKEVPLSISPGRMRHDLENNCLYALVWAKGGAHSQELGEFHRIDLGKGGSELKWRRHTVDDDVEIMGNFDYFFHEEELGFVFSYFKGERGSPPPPTGRHIASWTKSTGLSFLYPRSSHPDELNVSYPFGIRVDRPSDQIYWADINGNWIVKGDLRGEDFGIVHYTRPDAIARCSDCAGGWTLNDTHPDSLDIVRLPGENDDSSTVEPRTLNDICCVKDSETTTCGLDSLLHCAVTSDDY